MEIRIYKITNNVLGNVKKILEVNDIAKLEIACEKCGKKTIEINADRLEKFEEKKECPDCGEELTINSRELVINEFARNGYTIRDGRIFEKEGVSYLYIKSESEFFEKHENEILIENVEKITGEEFEEIKSKIEGEMEAAAEGIGGIFG